MDKKRNLLDQLQALEQLASEMDGYSDSLEEIPDMDEIMGMTGMSGIPGMDGMESIAGMPGMSVPGEPKDVMLYDTIIVHGLMGDYKLSFEENEDGLVINLIK